MANGKLQFITIIFLLKKRRCNINHLKVQLSHGRAPYYIFEFLLDVSYIYHTRKLEQGFFTMLHDRVYKKKSRDILIQVISIEY